MNYHAVLAGIESASKDGDIYELICDAALETQGSMDHGRFFIGELASQISKQYGQNRIEGFAKAINLPVTRVREYRTVTKWYGGYSACAELLEMYPNVAYTHIRMAKRCGGLKQAHDFLERCAVESWTVEEAGVKLSEQLGTTEAPARKLLDAVGVVTRVDFLDSATAVMTIQIGEGIDPDVLMKLNAQPARLKVYEVKA